MITIALRKRTLSPVRLVLKVTFFCCYLPQWCFFVYWVVLTRLELGNFRCNCDCTQDLYCLLFLILSILRCKSSRPLCLCGEVAPTPTRTKSNQTSCLLSLVSSLHFHASRCCTENEYRQYTPVTTGLLLTTVLCTQSREPRELST